MESKLTAPLPWQREVWDALIARHRAGNLPHALLLSGVRGLGKGLLAQALAQGLFCESPQADGRGCGHCRNCAQFEAGSHPDYRRVVPEEGKSIIAVDQCRELSEFLALTSHYGRYRVVILEPAEAMNVAAANSLLKTLEEPPRGSLLILVSHQPSALLPTIRSRCQQITLHPPAGAVARDWLSQQPGLSGAHDLLLTLAGGAPLQALQLGQGEALQQRAAMLQDLKQLKQGGAVDLSAIATRWAELGMPAVVHWLQTWLADMVRLKAVAQPPQLANPDIAGDLQAIAAGVDWEVLYSQVDRLNEMARRASSSLNAQMQLEEFLIGWQRELMPRPAPAAKSPRR